MKVYSAPLPVLVVVVAGELLDEPPQAVVIRAASIADSKPAVSFLRRISAPRFTHPDLGAPFLCRPHRNFKLIKPDLIDFTNE